MKRRLPLAAWLLIATLPVFAQQKRPAAPTTHGFEINGKVLNAVTGDVVRHASVQLAPSQLASRQERQDPERFETGTDGNFVFHNVPAGKYNLSAQAKGYPQQSLEQHGQFSTAIVAGPDKVSTGIIFRLRPEGSISGRVLDEHNEPARNAQVLLFEKGNDAGRHQVERRNMMMTDDIGEYRFSHLQSGTYYVAVSAQPWYGRYLQGFGGGPANQAKPERDPALDVAYPVIYYPNATEADGAGAIVLRPGDHIGTDFDLTPVQSLHLTVRSASGEQPVQPMIREEVFGEPVGFLQPTINWRNSQNGTPTEIEVSGIAPGTYDFGSMPRNGYRSGGPMQMHNHEVNLVNDGEIDPSALGGLEEIHGKIKFDGGDVPPNPVIQLRESSTGHLLGSRIDDDGEFHLQPQHPGRYVIALGNAPGYAIRTITANGARVSGRTIDFTSTQSVELTLNASEGVGTVNGIVTNADQTVSASMVVLVPSNIDDNLTLFRRDQSDSDGSFTLRDVVPGTYTAVAIQNGWDMEWASPEALRPYLAKGTQIQITGKQQLDVKLAAQ